MLKLPSAVPIVVDPLHPLASLGLEMFVDFLSLKKKTVFNFLNCNFIFSAGTLLYRQWEMKSLWNQCPVEIHWVSITRIYFGGIHNSINIYLY